MGIYHNRQPLPPGAASSISDPDRALVDGRMASIGARLGDHLIETETRIMDLERDNAKKLDRVAELEAALRVAQTAIAKCLREGGHLDSGPDAGWWTGIVTAQQTIAAALRST